MTYKLRTGLPKGKIYCLVRDFLPEDISIPRQMDCDLKRYHDHYWLSWNGSEVSFTVFAGRAQIRIKQYVWLEDDNEPVQELDRVGITIPFQYLLEHGYLKEVV